MDALLGFASGVGVTLTGALVANLLTKSREKQAKLEQHRFQIYMKLMDVHSDYFWFTTAEFHKEKVRPDLRERCRSRSWEIVDMLRAADDLEHLDEILDVLMGHGYKTAIARYEALGTLLSKLGKRVNPRYQRKILEIGKDNIRLLSSGEKTNAPGSIYPWT